MKKITITPSDFPRALHPWLIGAAVYDTSASSSATVLYSDAGCYIKIDEKDMLQREARLTELFSHMGLGVPLLCYLSHDRDYLVTQTAIGKGAQHFSGTPEQLCEILAGAMRRLHQCPASAAPVSSRLQRYWDSADGPFSGGYYDESTQMPRFSIAAKTKAWAIMQANRHRLKADTLIHGDFCLPNVILNGGQFNAFIDCNMSGLGDRHIDLYWCIWSLQHSLKTDRYTDYFLDQYGRANFDEEMLSIIAAFELFG